MAFWLQLPKLNVEQKFKEGQKMKSKGKKSKGELVANGLIVAMVILGTMFFVNLPGATQEEGLISKLFIGFLGAIITIQVIPAIVLVGAMVKGVAQNARRTVKHVPVSGTENKH